jgi:hypothetical protein
MPSGIEIRKPDGTVTIAPTDRLCKIIGSNWTNYARNGFFDVPEFANAPGWVVCVSLNISFATGMSLPYVFVDQAARQVKWNSDGNENGVTANNVYLIWGIY